MCVNATTKHNTSNNHNNHNTNCTNRHDSSLPSISLRCILCNLDSSAIWLILSHSGSQSCRFLGKHPGSVPSDPEEVMLRRNAWFRWYKVEIGTLAKGQSAYPDMHLTSGYLLLDGIHHHPPPPQYQSMAQVKGAGGDGLMG
uniref:Uncharacterized protein n=1 Tax=Eutreptiella gymnastica TaxID=73025 RepID=A0A7S1N457_9EUGL